MKKVFGYILSFALAVMLIVAPAESVFAQGLGLSVSSSSVSVGKTVKVTVSMPSGYFGTVVVSSSDEGVLSNGGDGVANIGDAASMPTSQSFTFTAKAAGSCTIKAYCTVVGDAEGNDAGGVISGASTTVTVTGGSSGASDNSGSSNSGNNSGNAGNSGADSNNGDSAQQDDTDKEPEKSSNSALGSLVISSGSLSPEFSADTKDYTATVDYSVSSLAVTATPADSKASVTSVTGNDSLEVGENTVSVVVTAENGSTSTYNIVVTRRTEDDPENSDQQDNWKKFDIGGTEWTMVNEIPEDVIPEGFEHSKTVIDGLEYNTLHATFADITLVFLQSDSGNGLFVYDTAQNAAYEYVRINSESHFIVILLPNVDDIPADYNEVSLSIEGKGVATAYQSKDENANPDFYLVYAMNDLGESGWYTYDSVDGTYIRTDVTAPTVVQQENDTVNNSIIPGIENKYLVVAAALIIIIIILLIILIITLRRNKQLKAGESADGEDAEEYDEEYSDDEVEETDTPDDDYSVEESDEQLENTDAEVYDNIGVDGDVTEETDDIDNTVDVENVNEEAVAAANTEDKANFEDITNEFEADSDTEDANEETQDTEADDTSESNLNNDDDNIESENETEADEQLEAIDTAMIRRTVEIKPDSVSADTFDDQTGSAAEESLESQVQRAIDDFTGKESSEKDSSDDDEGDLEFIDLN